MVDPAHTVFAPLTVPAFGKITTLVLAEAVVVPQGVADVYVMVMLPGVRPVTTPVVGFTDAIKGSLLLHEPPLRPLLVNVAMEPIQTVAAPLTIPAFGRGSTEIILLALELPQPFAKV